MLLAAVHFSGKTADLAAKEWGGWVLFSASVLFVLSLPVIRRLDPSTSAEHGFTLAAVGGAILAVGVPVIPLAVASFVVPLLVRVVSSKALYLARRDCTVTMCVAAAVAVVQAVGMSSTRFQAVIAIAVQGLGIYCIVERKSHRELATGIPNLKLESAVYAMIITAIPLASLTSSSRKSGVVIVFATVVALAFYAVIVRQKNVRDRSLDTLADLSDANTPFREGHSHRVAELAATIASCLGLNSRSIWRAWWGGRVADLGLTHVDSNIAAVNRKLTEVELAAVRLHASKSVDIISAFGVSRAGREIVLCHHERIDGSGYLRRPPEEIPLLAHVVACADAFVSMREDRHHRPALSEIEALDAIRVTGNRHYPVAVVDALILARELMALDAIIDEHTKIALVKGVGNSEESDGGGVFSVVHLDPQIDDRSYRLSIVQKCGHILLQNVTPAIVVRDNVDSVDMGWLGNLDGVQVWAPDSLSVSGITAAAVFRYEVGAKVLVVRDRNGHVLARAPYPGKRDYSWRTFSLDTIIRYLIIPAAASLLGAAGLLASAMPSFVIPSASMLPTFDCGDRIITVARGSFSSPLEPGQVVVVEAKADQSALSPQDSQSLKSTFFVKRIAAVAGDVVEARGSSLLINGKEEFLGSIVDSAAQESQAGIPEQAASATDFVLKIPKGKMYVLGDNRSNSIDSRAFGAIRESDVIGRAVGIIWPLNRVKLVSTTVPVAPVIDECESNIATTISNPPPGSTHRPSTVQMPPVNE